VAVRAAGHHEADGGRAVAEKRSNGKRGGLLESAPTEELSDEFKHLLSALADRVLSGANDRVGGLTDKLTGLAEGVDSPVGKAAGKAAEKTAEGKSPLRAGLSAAGEGVKSTIGKALKGGGGGGKGGKEAKVTNIVEQIDIGAPRRLVYNQWTQFQDFSKFMKKVEGVDQEQEQKLNFKAQVLWSHRSWEATIVEQEPDRKIVWRSKGDKGHVDGAVTFHALTPDLTRVVVVLEYHPQGLFERTGNLWRAQGRRVRLELKHFQRHVMTHTLLHPDDVDGWRGEIHEGKVTKSNEDAQAEEESDDAEDENDDELEDSAEDEDEEAEDDEDAEGDEEDAEDEAEDEGDELEDYDEEDADEDEDEETDEDEDEDETDEDEDEDEDETDEDEDEAEDSDEDAEDEDEVEERPARRPRSRRPARAGRR
jgi:uncharacterized membrane protein